MRASCANIARVLPGIPVELKTFAFDPHVVEIGGTRMGLVEWPEEFERGYAEADGWYRKLCAALGEPAVDVEVPLRRANPFAIRDTLENFDQVACVLRGTRFAWMVDGD